MVRMCRRLDKVLFLYVAHAGADLGNSPVVTNGLMKDFVCAYSYSYGVGGDACNPCTIIIFFTTVPPA